MSADGIYKYAKCLISSAIVILAILAPSWSMPVKELWAMLWGDADTFESAQEGISKGALSHILQPGHHQVMVTDMVTDRKIRLGASRTPNARFLMVSLGIALFVIGFLVTVTSFSQMNVGRAHDGTGVPLSIDNERFGEEADMLILAGIMTSLTGIVVATVGPAVSVMRGRDRVVR
jgi:uncharacterized membrane protein YhaH (DUF805 family)